MLLILFGRGVRIVRGWGILVLDYEGVEGSLRGVKDCSVLLAGVTYRYVLLAGLKVVAYY